MFGWEIVLDEPFDFRQSHPVFAGEAPVMVAADVLKDPVSERAHVGFGSVWQGNIREWCQESQRSSSLSIAWALAAARSLG